MIVRKTLVLNLAALLSCALAAAGCSGGAPVPPAPVVTQQSASSARVIANAKGRDLLYVSTPWGGGINIMTYPQGKAVGHIPNYGGPFGLCSDKRGNVYAMGVESQIIVEYAHGGLDPIATLSDSGQGPEGCSVDPSSDDLAVASGTGDVQVYPDGRGTPANYGSSGVYSFFFCTYDDKGNLFADGETEAGSFVLAELPKGGSALTLINVNATIDPEFAVQWDGKYLAVQASDDSNVGHIDRVRVSGSTGKVVATTKLDDDAQVLPAQFWIQGRAIAEIAGSNGGVSLWRYPAGGAPLRAFTGVGSGGLIGVTVSAGK